MDPIDSKPKRDHNTSRPLAFPASLTLKVDADGRLPLPKGVLMLTSLQPGGEVAISSGPAGTLFVRPLPTDHPAGSGSHSIAHNLSEASADRLHAVLAECGGVGSLRTQQAADILGTHPEELAQTAGLLAIESTSTETGEQNRLARLLRIIVAVATWYGDETLLPAYAWYRTERLEGFRNKTAAELVRTGYGHAVIDYLDGVADGGRG
ncbi:hypothetical protein [Parvularcula dongshanensis]|uniref:SpoVT-AbrB domain-containing protein n=1 Tax=Parvularcula dongshanensis TaxID=1173995 RepID=A0A840I5V1_9PROT|nr:hypothetical protein [Parvularcula dongshanensis]MBB4660249.1 hypothetical protein [Parvularcula dongshanensis]